MKNRKKKEHKKSKRKNNQSTSTASKQDVKRKSIPLIEISITLTILGIIGNFIYQIMHWREITDSAKQLGLWGFIGAIIGVILLRKLIDIIFDKLFD